jgi:hypothetical protein
MTYPPNTSVRGNTKVFDSLDHKSAVSKFTINESEQNILDEDNLFSLSKQDNGPEAAL